MTGALAVILVFATFRRELAISQSARVMALISFFAVLALHQATMLVQSSVPAGMQTFMASSWMHPTTGSFDFLLMVGSVLESSIVGMFGLLIFGLIHPAWRPEMTTAMTKSAKNGISLVAASACVGIVIGIVQQTGIAGDFSIAIKDVVETNLFLALVGIMFCSLITGNGSSKIGGLLSVDGDADGFVVR
ncbi:MAG: hypothetical protein R3C05_15360 [Pirellulaceae bacterium]